MMTTSMDRPPHSHIQYIKRIWHERTSSDGNCRPCTVNTRYWQRKRRNYSSPTKQWRKKKLKMWSCRIIKHRSEHRLYACAGYHRMKSCFPVPKINWRIVHCIFFLLFFLPFWSLLSEIFPCAWSIRKSASLTTSHFVAATAVTDVLARGARCMCSIINTNLNWKFIFYWFTSGEIACLLATIA